MKQRFTVTLCILAALSLAASAFADTKKGGKIDGKKKFQEHCTSCHPDGGNLMKPNKTLKKKDLQANGIKNAQDIVTFMRKPATGMPAFDKNAISDGEAKAIAEYILKSFK